MKFFYNVKYMWNYIRSIFSIAITIVLCLFTWNINITFSGTVLLAGVTIIIKIYDIEQKQIKSEQNKKSVREILATEIDYNINILWKIENEMDLEKYRCLSRYPNSSSFQKRINFLKTQTKLWYQLKKYYPEIFEPEEIKKLYECTVELENINKEEFWHEFNPCNDFSRQRITIKSVRSKCEYIMKGIFNQEN